MNKAKMYYNKFLHYHLLNVLLNEDTFSVLTTLTDDEISIGFSYSKFKVSKVIEIMSLITQYQRAKLSEDKLDFLIYRRKLTQSHCLWSDAALFKKIPTGHTSLRLGLIVLKTFDRRLAIVYSMRLGIDLSRDLIKVEHPEYLQYIFLSLLHSDKINNLYE